MANDFTSQQLIDQLKQSSNGGQTTELYNALRDFNSGIDTGKLNKLTDQQLLDARLAQTGGTADLTGDKSVLKNGILPSRNRSKLISDITSFNSVIQRQ